MSPMRRIDPMNHSYRGTRPLRPALQTARDGDRDQGPPTAAEQLVGYLERRGVRHVFGLCGHTNIAVLAAMSAQQHRVRQRPPRAGRCPRSRWLCARHRSCLGRTQPPQPRTHQRRHGRRQCGPRLHPHGRDRRRRALPLLRQAPSSRGQPARRRLAVRDLSAVRQAELARRQAGAASRDHREGVPARRERPARAGTRRRADGRLLPARRPSPVRTTRSRHQDVASAVSRRRDRPSHRRPARRSSEPGHLRRWRCAAVEGQRRAPTLRRPHGHPGRPQPDGQRCPQRRPSAGAGHDRLLGNAARQRHVPRRRRHPRHRNTLQGSRQQLVVPGLHVQHPGHGADPHRHRAQRDQPRLSDGDRRRGRRQGGAQGSQSSRTRAVSGWLRQHRGRQAHQ